ncbi:MAG: hypothetical protein IPH82_19675 [Chloroflexi bacterium]|nr:hypothetical protein [Chloroflexota bacterium]
MKGSPFGGIGHSLAQAEQGLAQVTPPVRVGAIRPEQSGNVGAGLGTRCSRTKVGDKGGDALGGKESGSLSNVAWK